MDRFVLDQDAYSLPLRWSHDDSPAGEWSRIVAVSPLVAGELRGLANHRRDQSAGMSGDEAAVNDLVADVLACLADLLLVEEYRNGDVTLRAMVGGRMIL